MRLLHTSELTLKKFASPKHPDDGSPFKESARTVRPPPYAILSHRWAENAEDEVSFAELSTAELSTGRQRDCEGWHKIVESCKLARAHQIQWIWIDTCCIDKSSNTELSEDLNLMYTYYARAQECYAYLYDVVSKPKGGGDRLTTQESSPSEWFSRGWTLQELIAPGTSCKGNDQSPSMTSSKMIFFDQNWKQLGQKTDPDICAELSRHSRIAPEYLRSPGTHKSASIAMKMSWAATRTTEKLEDRVYSLLGVFDVNMSILYGEGEASAFMRLQLELMARSEDQSLFAWIRPSRYGAPQPCGMLATSLDDFADSNDIVTFPIKDKEKPLYGMTKEGLEFRVFNGGSMMTNLEGRSSNSKETIMLACSKSSGGQHVDRRNVVVIELRKSGGFLQRVEPGTWKLSNKFNVPTSKAWLNPGLRRVFYVKQS